MMMQRARLRPALRDGGYCNICKQERSAERCLARLAWLEGFMIGLIFAGMLIGICYKC